MTHQAAFINAIAEEGTKAEAVEWLQKTWDERCDLHKLLFEAMTLLYQMPVKHPQQAQKRDDLAKRCGFTAPHLQS